MHWRLFEELYSAFARRKAIERVMSLKEAMVSGVWGNSNYDDKDTRLKLLKEIDDSFRRAMDRINGLTVEEEIDPADPFFAAMKVPEIDDGVEANEDFAEALAELDQT